MRCATSGIWSTAALTRTMAVITPRNLSADGLGHTPQVDLLESGDERGPLSLRTVRLPRWAGAVVGAVAVAVLAGGLVAGAQQREQRAVEAARIDVEVRPAGARSTTVRGVARGEMSLLLVNRRDQRVGLGELQVAVEGLRLTSVEPDLGRPLAGFEERLVVLTFVVPDCDRLVLPGALRLSLTGEGQPPERREVPVRGPGVEGAGLTLGSCPPSARGRDAGTARDVGVRPAGGTVERDGRGAVGALRLEVRNAGPPLQLVSYTGEVPGVTFTERRIDGGRSIDTDGLVVVRLAFRIEDCAALQPAGRLVLVVRRGGAVQELGLRAVAEPVAGLGPQVSLGLLFDACD